MAFGYIPVDRAQQFLLPPDMGEWLPEGHLAWFVLDVVERLDTAELHRSHPNVGVGRAAYDPDMMLALLVYAYCTSVRSSRQVERLCYVDIAFRVICAGNLPDHTTIARFRQAHERVAQELFVDALALCAAAGLVKLGVVAVDGTRVGANASLKANRDRSQLEAEVAAMFAQAEAVDQAEDGLFGEARGDELPPGLAQRRSRRARLDAALAELAASAGDDGPDDDSPGRLERAEKALAAFEAELASPDSQLSRAERQLEQAEAARAGQRHAAEQRSGRRRGRPLNPSGGTELARAQAKRDHKVSIAERRRRHLLARAQKARAVATRRARSAAAAKANLTDPESRLMRVKGGWAQAYNAQAAVSSDGLVLASVVTQDHHDSAQCQPMMAATLANLAAAGSTGPLGTFLFDKGYLSTDNIVAPGPERLIATQKSWKLSRAAKEHGYLQGEPPPGAGPLEAMEHKLLTKAGAEAYRRRQHTVEPVFGHHKFNRGYTRFVRRGRSAADAEWALINMTHNLLKLFAFLRSGPVPV
jgi:transposase